MRCLVSDNHNPHFNLATEEYFLKTSQEELFILYINEPCIVVGKHQNILSEINLPYVRENKIKLARRISGGGTVYQDLNNLNFSFIHNCINRDKISFTEFTRPILEALREMGLEVHFSDRNDLLLSSEKISGNAMHIYKNRVLSHGTLLFNTDLTKLSEALKSNNSRFNDKSIKSVRSRVTNIFPYLKEILMINTFTDRIFENILSKNENSHIQLLNTAEEWEINKIAEEKFNTWQWTYGYSPKYTYKNSFNIDRNTINVEFSVERGLISNTKVITHPLDTVIDDLLCQTLNETLHDYDTIKMKLNKISLNNSFLKDNLSDYCDQLF